MIALVTGCGGLIGTEASHRLIQDGYDVIGLDNGMRAYFFGDEASTGHNITELYGPTFKHFQTDIRDHDTVDRLFARYRPDVIVHTAAQPSHDWAAREPLVDFGVNATGTLHLLQSARTWTPDSPFIHCSTSKVYGDHPNLLPLIRVGDRLDLPVEHEYWAGIDTSMSVDLCTHSLFGVSKLAGDLLVQEYGRYFQMPTVSFRPGCLTGGFHAGTELHGFLSYLMRCTVTGKPYRVIGYDGLQVRCNIHSADLVDAFLHYVHNPRPAAVYNIGGGRANSISVLEAIDECQRITGRELDWTHEPTPRTGDHRWWISSNLAFELDYPAWQQTYTVPAMLAEIHDRNLERWAA